MIRETRQNHCCWAPTVPLPPAGTRCPGPAPAGHFTHGFFSKYQSPQASRFSPQLFSAQRNKRDGRPLKARSLDVANHQRFNSEQASQSCPNLPGADNSSVSSSVSESPLRSSLATSKFALPGASAQHNGVTSSNALAWPARSLGKIQRGFPAACIKPLGVGRHSSG